MRVLILSLLWLNGCSSAAVRCDAHLRPINAPAAKAASEPRPAPVAAFKEGSP
jgi:hypothetical protein